MPRTRKQDVQPLRNQGYGDRQRAEQSSAQAAQAGASRAPAAGGPGGGGGGGDRFARALSAAEQLPVPTQTLRSPTSRPNEPVTAGLPTGPGGGPDMLPQMPNRTNPDQRRQEALLMARWLPALEALAGSSRSTEATKRFYRRVRHSVPPGVIQQLVTGSEPIRDEDA